MSSFFDRFAESSSTFMIVSLKNGTFYGFYDSLKFKAASELLFWPLRGLFNVFHSFTQPTYVKRNTGLKTPFKRLILCLLITTEFFA